MEEAKRRTKSSAYDLNWNSRTFHFMHERDLLQYTFLLYVKRVKYKPSDVIKEDLHSLCTMFLEMFTACERECVEELKKVEYKKLNRKIHYFIRTMNRTQLNGEQAEQKIYNFVLGIDNLNTLHGFGIVGNRFGNPEKESVIQQIHISNISRRR